MKYFFGFLISIGLIVLVVILVIKGFTNNEPKKNTQAPLSSYSNTSTEVSLNVSGPIVNNQEHYAYEITVGRNQTTIETKRGYEGTPIETLSYSNNTESYTNFLRALDFAGFTKGIKSETSSDERGTCATGSRYVVEINSDQKQIQRLWTTSCKGGGTFAGGIEQVRQLFNSQIPRADYAKITRGLRL
jgi:hypothetical protein